MATHVYANGNEIASKSADGSSKHAFPDICHTPPATASPTPIKPFPPGVPIPYPNSCHASDITNGSRTVFILGKEIALENHSYFSVSEGDDAATRKLAKGIISGAVKGRCFFQTWSPNVKVEGRAVTRHLDLVSHNHKNPGNTGLFPYLSIAADRKPCEKTEARINKACAPKPDPNRPAPPKKKSWNPFSGTPEPEYNKDWRRDHCDFLQFSAGRLNETNAKQFLEQAKAAREKIDAARDGLDTLLSEYGGELLARGGAALVEQAVWSKIRSGLYVGGGALIGAGIGVWAAGAGAIPGAAVGAKAGGVLAIAHSAYNAYEAALLAMDGKALYDALSGELERMKGALNELDPLARYTKPDGTIDTERANTFLADLQDAMATANACTRARKCNLVPKRTQVDRTHPGVGNETAGGRGCCPGQTGHHLLSDAMISHTGCANYDYDRAPTVCVEGYSQFFGSHRRAHSALATALENKDKAQKIAPDGTLSLDDGIDAAVESHTLAFLASGCDPQCTRAQLEAYYKQIRCPGNARVRMVGTDGKPARPTPGGPGI
jgi:hypothetical protein